MNILVTGGAGYVGSAAARWLIASGHRVTVLDDLSLGHRAAVPPDDVLHVGRIDDRQAVLRALEVWPDAPEPHWVASKAEQCGVRNGYLNPAALGVDRWAAMIGARLSRTLRTIMSRLMGMILLAIAIEMIVAGAIKLLPGLAG